MSGRIPRWIRVVAPPWWSVLLFALIYLGVETFVRMMEWISRDVTQFEPLTDLYRVRAVVAAPAAVLYGLYRVWAFHPVIRPAYRRWIEQVPWTPAKRLPLASLTPGPAELLLITFLCWLSGRGNAQGALAPLVGFLVAYCLAICMIAAMCHRRRTWYLGTLGLGLALRLVANPWVAMGVLLAVFAALLIEVRALLDPSCWPTEDPLLKVRLAFGTARARAEAQELSRLVMRARPESLGWAHGLIGPRPVRRHLLWPETCLLPLVAGWLFYAVLAGPVASEGTVEAAPWLLLVFMANLVCAVFRTVVYVSSHWPPISFWGRLWTGRLIIPGYDKVFLAPLGALAVFFTLEFVLDQLAISPEIAQPIVAAACIAAWMNIGPGLRDWELTGQHRIRPSTVRFPSTEIKQI